MKLLIDMNLPPRLASLITGKGIESTHWYTIGAPDATDTEIMSYARENNYIVLTCDLDFSAILSTTHGQKPSVIQIRIHDIDTEQIANLITATVLHNEGEIKEGAVISIDAKKARLRILPL